MIHGWELWDVTSDTPCCGQDLETLQTQGVLCMLDKAMISMIDDDNDIDDDDDNHHHHKIL